MNQDACKLYVEHLNGLDCTADVDSDDVCPPSLDEGGGGKCDAFYACLTESSTCDGDTFVSGVEACSSCEVRS